MVYLALWFFMKLGPCLRNFVVSPISGHPIVPCGNPLLAYIISFHFKRAKHKQTLKTNPHNNTAKTAIEATYKASETQETAAANGDIWLTSVRGLCVNIRLNTQRDKLENAVHASTK